MNTEQITDTAASGQSALTDGLGMSREERNKRFNDRLDEEVAHEDVCMWMSFCDTEKPKGQQFIGVVITRAKGMAHAIDKTHRLGINPGGEVMSYETNPDDIASEHFDKLLTKDDLVAAGYIAA